jgi:hypothetical protein
LSTEAGEKVTPEKDMTWSFFMESFHASNSNQGQQEVDSSRSGIDQTLLQPPKPDPLWNILPEKIKTSIAEDEYIKINSNLYKYCKQRGKDGYLNELSWRVTNGQSLVV